VVLIKFRLSIFLTLKFEPIPKSLFMPQWNKGFTRIIQIIFNNE
jgi:hypothetical protein